MPNTFENLERAIDALSISEDLDQSFRCRRQWTPRKLMLSTRDLPPRIVKWYNAILPTNIFRVPLVDLPFGSLSLFQAMGTKKGYTSNTLEGSRPIREIPCTTQHMDRGVSYREVTRNKGFIIFTRFRIAHYVLMNAFPELPPLPTILYASARRQKVTEI